MDDKALTYASYLRIDDLLALQERRSDPPEHDEMLFVVVHQVYELWFKQILHETALLQRRLEGGNGAGALHTARRVAKILKTIVGQLDVLETMTPLQFLSFRDRLESASGFQSAQFREVEAVLGKREASAVAAQPEGSPARARLEAAQASRTLWDSFLSYLSGRGHPIAPEVLRRDVRRPIQPHESVQDVLVTVYRADADAALVSERLVDLDEGIQEWRYRHVKMVERTIGTKPGTGGSSGVGYLRATLFQPVFPDLWEIRSRL